MKPDLTGFAEEVKSGVEGATSGAEQASEGIGLAIAAGAAAAAVGLGAVISKGIEYEGVLNEIQAVSGATGAQMQQVGTVAKELGSDLSLSGVSAADAAGAILELTKGGLSLSDAMTAAKGTLQLAGAAQIDGARAAEIQSNALNQFALSAGDAGRVADVLANTANAASGSIEDIALAMKYVGPVAQGMKISIEDTATAIGLLANSGIQADNAGTSLRGMLASLAAPSTQASKAIDELGIKAFDSSGKFVGFRSVIDQLSQAQARMTDEQFASAAATAFGREPLAAITALAEQGAPAFDKMGQAVRRQGGAADVAAAKMKGLGGALESFNSNLETAAISIYEIIRGPLEALVRQATSVVDVLNDVLSGKIDLTKIQGLNSVIETGAALWKNFLGILENGKQAIQPVADGIKSLFDSASTGTGAIGVAGQVIQDLGIAAEFASGILIPLGATVGFLVGVFKDLPTPIQLAAIALLALKVGPAILGGILSAIRGIPLVGNAAANSLTRVGSGFRTIGSAVNGLPGTLRAGTAAVRGFGDQMRLQQSLANSSGQSVSRFGAAIATLEARVPTIAAMGNAFRVTSTAVSGFGDRVAAGVTTGLRSLGQLPAAVATAANAVRTGLTTAATSAATALRNIPTAVAGAASSLRTGLSAAATAAGTAIRSIPTAVAGAATSIRSGFTTAVTAAGAAFRNLPTLAANAFRGIPGAVGTGISALGRFTGAVAGAGAAMGTGLLKGVSGLMGALGGPWGAVLLAAGIAVTVFAGKQQEAKAAAAEHAADIDRLRDSLDKLTSSATNATRELVAQELTSQKLSDNTTSLATALTKAGISTTDFVDATTGNAAALEKVNSQLFVAAQATPGLQALYAKWKPRLDEAGVSFGTLTAAAIGNSGAFDELTQKLGVSGSGFEVWKQDLASAVGPLGEIGSLLGDQVGKFNAATEAQKTQNAAVKNYDDVLKTLAENKAFEVLKNGGAITEPMRAGFDALGVSAVKLATDAGKAAEGISGVEGGALKARESMQKSRDSFIAAATAAGIAGPAAEDLANKIGLIPAAAETIYRLNATGANAELIKINELIKAVPAGKTITFSTLSDDAIAKLRALGFTVEQIPGSKEVKVTAPTEEAKAGLDSFIASMNNKTIKMLLDADKAPFTGKINEALTTAGGTTAIMKLDGEPTLVNGKIQQAVTFADGSKGTIVIDGNKTNADGSTNAAVTYANGQVAIIKIHGNADGAVQAARNALAAIGGLPAAVIRIVQIFERANAVGGVFTPMHDGGVLPMASGGTVTGSNGRRMRKMSGSIATIVPPNTWRVIGDRQKGDEAFIPINNSPRSVAILQETARRMGYELSRNFASGGIATEMSQLVTALRNRTPAAFPPEIRDLVGEIRANSGRGDVVVNLVANNPVAEKSSATLSRNMRTLSQMGAFG